MKNYNRQSFKNLLAILVVFTICPILGADDANNDTPPSQEGIVDSLIGPGSFTRGYYAYFTTKPRGQNCIMGVGIGAGCLSSTLIGYLINSINEEDPTFAHYAFATINGTLTLMVIQDIYKNLPSRDDLGLIRDIQKAQAHKIVEDENIKKYISELLTWCDRTHVPPYEDNPRIQFFNQYHERLAQLQSCTEQVLIERELCRKVDNHFGVECIGDPEAVFGSRTLNPVRYLRLDMLRKILDQDNTIAEKNNYKNIPEFLNELLGYAGQNIKPAIANQISPIS